MPLSPAQGLLLSNDFLVGRFIEDSPFVIQPAHFLPFFEVPGDSERWSTTAAILPASALPFCGPIADQTTVPIARSYSFGELATSRIVCYGTQDLQSNANDQSAAQLEMAFRQLLYGFFRLLFIGNPANPGEFIGFDNIITGAAFAGQIVDALGLALTTRLLDRAQRRLKSGDNFEWLHLHECAGIHRDSSGLPRERDTPAGGRRRCPRRQRRPQDSVDDARQRLARDVDRLRADRAVPGIDRDEDLVPEIRPQAHPRDRAGQQREQKHVQESARPCPKDPGSAMTSCSLSRFPSRQFRTSP